jgi:Flp pilus assembly protein TadG
MRTRNDQGSVTAEAAFVFPVLFAVLALGLWLIGTVITNIRCIDAARDTARAVARGESLDSARQLGERAAPQGATITITRQDDTIRVEVTATPPKPHGLLAALPHPPPKATATLQTEPPQAHSLQRDPSQINLAQVAPIRTDLAQTDLAQADSAQTGPAQTGPAQTGPAQTGPAQTGPAQTGPAPSRSGPDRPGSSWIG